MRKFAGDIIVLGAGPAGLSAAFEILNKTDYRPIILEKNATLGGMGRTIPFGSGFVDVGGHRFHTKSKRVQEFWDNLATKNNSPFRIKERNSQLLFDGHYFNYPIRPQFSALRKLGLLSSAKIFLSYLLRDRSKPQTLEDFFKSTYGDKLFKFFFESYTEKVWGKKSSEIIPHWGGERLKRPGFFSRKETFLYPNEGPGAFWDLVGDEIIALGGEIKLNHEVISLGTKDSRVVEVVTNYGHFKGDYFLSTLPLNALTDFLKLKRYNLPFRSLVSVNFEFKREDLSFATREIPQWVYVHDKNVKVGRLQFYRAWDESMVPEQDKEILGLEYFENSDEDNWEMSDKERVNIALQDLINLGYIRKDLKPLHHQIFKVQHAYPCYWGDYALLNEIRDSVSSFQNLFSFGRQGLHRYINMDQTVMSAFRVVDYIREGGCRKKLWDDFTELHIPE